MKKTYLNFKMERVEGNYHHYEIRWWDWIIMLFLKKKYQFNRLTNRGTYTYKQSRRWTYNLYRTDLV